jgi:hypothetical protein
MTQAHYLESVHDDQAIDPQFKSLLRHHWQEEAQPAKLDPLRIDKLAREGGETAITRGFEDFAALGAAIDGLLSQQVQLDLHSLERACGRTLSADEKQEIATAQLKAYRYTFLVSGLVHPNFAATVEQLSPQSAEKLRDLASLLSR